jgi:hypothetical protein
MQDESPIMPKTPETPMQLINDLLDTLDDLGSSGMARIDARAWYRHFARRAKAVEKTLKRGKAEKLKSATQPKPTK